MLPTPDTSHLSFSNIYPPSEDSYLLLDTISHPSQTAYLTTRFSPATSPAPLVLEVGTGSGILTSFVTTHATSIFGRSSILTMATDLNPSASKACAQTVSANSRTGSRASSGPDEAGGSFIGAVTADLASSVRTRSVDVLLFNPPYVPSETLPALPRSGIGDGDDADGLGTDLELLALATDGGKGGMEVTSRLLQQLDEILEATRGVAYVLFCGRNRVEGWDAREGWEVRRVEESGGKGGWERLRVLRFARKVG